MPRCQTLRLHSYPETLVNTFGEYISKHGMTQLRIAETQKYAHVTFFFNGGEEKQYEGEDRILVASPKISTFDLMPEMSAPEVSEKLNAAVRSGKYDAIIVNFANCDMVGTIQVLSLRQSRLLKLLTLVLAHLQRLL